VQPDDLSAIEDVELPEIIRAAIHLSHVSDVGAFVVERPRKANVKIRREDRSDKPSQNKLCKVAVAAANLAVRRDQVEKHFLAVRLRCEQMLDDEREVLRQLGGIPDEPILLVQPRHPLGRFDLFGKDGTADDPLCIIPARDAFYAFVG
jgi:hypothetical protein